MRAYSNSDLSIVIQLAAYAANVIMLTYAEIITLRVRVLRIDTLTGRVQLDAPRKTIAQAKIINSVFRVVLEQGLFKKATRCKIRHSFTNFTVHAFGRGG